MHDLQRYIFVGMEFPTGTPILDSSWINHPILINASQKELVVEAQLIEKLVAPQVIVDDHLQKSPNRPDPIEALMD